MITNGWSYVLFFIGTTAKIHWMTAVSSAYIAFLWLPISPEKLVTFAIALGLLKLLFPKDQKTLAILHQFYEKAKMALKKRPAKEQADQQANSLHGFVFLHSFKKKQLHAQPGLFFCAVDKLSDGKNFSVHSIFLLDRTVTVRSIIKETQDPDNHS